jgi:hypothetical protein
MGLTGLIVINADGCGNPYESIRMSGKYRKIVTTSEKHEVLIIRRPAWLQPQMCAACADEVGMLTPRDAAYRAGVTQRTIYRWVEEGLVHFAETTEGDLFVCLAPLFT